MNLYRCIGYTGWNDAIENTPIKSEDVTTVVKTTTILKNGIRLQ